MRFLWCSILFALISLLHPLGLYFDLVPSLGLNLCCSLPSSRAWWPYATQDTLSDQCYSGQSSLRSLRPNCWTWTALSQGHHPSSQETRTALTPDCLLLHSPTPSARPPKVSLFFPSPATIFIDSLSLGGLVEFWWCLKARTLKCARLGSRALA